MHGKSLLKVKMIIRNYSMGQIILKLRNGMSIILHIEVHNIFRNIFDEVGIHFEVYRLIYTYIYISFYEQWSKFIYSSSGSLCRQNTVQYFLFVQLFLDKYLFLNCSDYVLGR